MIGALISRYAFPALVVSAAFTVAVWILHETWQGGRAKANAEWELRWAVRDAGDLQARAIDEQQAREDERAAQAAMDQVQDDATKRIEAARADAVGAGASADRLREQVARLLAPDSTRRKAEACAGSPTAENPGNLLAVVLDKSIERNRELAAFADSALIAAQQCQAAYEGR
ncbi:hypothetical protein D3C77_105930 [compost metagenome]